MMRKSPKTVRRNHAGGNVPNLRSSHVIKPVVREPKALADTVGDTVSGAVRATQASYIRNRDKVRQTTRGLMDNVRDFSNAITQRIGSLFGGRRKPYRRTRHRSRRVIRRRNNRTRR